MCPEDMKNRTDSSAWHSRCWTRSRPRTVSHADDRGATALAFFCLVACAPAYAAEDTLVGTWRLTSFYREVAGTGVKENQLGEHPDGYLSYGADGRMLVLFVSDEQPRPRAEPTDDQRIMLHKTMLSYGGHVLVVTRHSRTSR